MTSSWLTGARERTRSQGLRPRFLCVSAKTHPRSGVLRSKTVVCYIPEKEMPETPPAHQQERQHGLRNFEDRKTQNSQLS